MTCDEIWRLNVTWRKTTFGQYNLSTGIKSKGIACQSSGLLAILTVFWLLWVNLVGSTCFQQVLINCGQLATSTIHKVSSLFASTSFMTYSTLFMKFCLSFRKFWLFTNLLPKLETKLQSKCSSCNMFLFVGLILIKLMTQNTWQHKYFNINTMSHKSV